MVTNTTYVSTLPPSFGVFRAGFFVASTFAFVYDRSYLFQVEILIDVNPFVPRRFSSSSEY